MSTLRDEIAELMIPPDRTSPNYERQAGHYDMAKTILMLVDNHIEAAIASAVKVHEQRHSMPSDERPARSELYTQYSDGGDYVYGEKEDVRTRAIVEAIDANTEAQSAASFHLLAAIGSLTAAVKYHG
jgi:hypothetical protein